MATITAKLPTRLKEQSSVSENEMEQIGFWKGIEKNTDQVFFKDIPGYELSLSAHVYGDGRPPKVVVIDERTMEPYDYLSVLKHNGRSKPALKAKAEVEMLMRHFVKKGYIKGWNNKPSKQHTKMSRVGESNQQERRH